MIRKFSTSQESLFSPNHCLCSCFFHYHPALRAVWIRILGSRNFFFLGMPNSRQGGSGLWQPSKHRAAREGLNFILQLQSPISLFPVNDIIAYIKPLKHVSFICLISNSEHTSWKLCLIVKLKTFGFPSLAEICRERASSLVGFARSHFYTAIGASQKANQMKLQNRITSVQPGNTSYISLPLHSGQDAISPKSCSPPGASRARTPLCARRRRASLSMPGKKMFQFP